MDAADYTKLVIARQNVLCSSELNCIDPPTGFLFIARKPGSQYEIALCWMALNAIPTSELPAFVAASSSNSSMSSTRFIPQTPSDSALQEQSPVAAQTSLVGSLSVTTVPKSLCAATDTIQSLTLSPILTLSRGHEACVQQLVIGMQDGSKWPPLQMDAFGNEKNPPSMTETVQILRRCFRRVGKDIVGCDVPNVYFVSDKLSVAPTRWPDVLPHPQESSIIYKAGAFGMDVVSSIVGRPIATKIEDVGWDMLEQFAKVTTFAKAKTSRALEHPLARPFLPYVPEQIRSIFLSSAEAEALLNDYDSAGRYLEQFAQDFQRQITRRISRAGSPQNTESFIIEYDQTRSYEAISAVYTAHFSGFPLTMEEWMSWQSNQTNLLKYKDLFYARIFSGGIEPAVRPMAWKYLLKSYSFADTLQDQTEISAKRREQYFNLKMSWMEVIETSTDEHSPKLDNGPVGDENEDADLFSKIRERKYRVEKDAVRTDRNTPYYESASEDGPLFAGLHVGDGLVTLRDVLMTYTIYNFDLGYVQGMSDLCSPILEVMDDEVETFWVFCEYMEKMNSHFSRNQLGMQLELRRLELLLKLIDPPLYRHMEQTDSVNMFCCFRWLLICFKREFPFQEIKTLWEVIWSCPLTTHFHLFVAVGILNMNRDQLFHQQAFDEVLKFINGLSDKIPVPETVGAGQVLLYLARDLFSMYAPSELCVHLPALPSIDAMLKNPDLSVDASIEHTEAKVVECDLSDDRKKLMQYWKNDMDDISFEEWTEIMQLFIAPTL
ncbi:hypothetical protein BDV3_006242 [Batrachochytrium dendrobatidis]